MDGLLLIDKAKGSSSFQVIAKTRRALGTRAVGHIGTLDPLATGLLVVLIGRFTRLSNYLMAGDKKYRAVIELGTATNTDDKEGEVTLEGDIEHVDLELICSVLPTFVGAQRQIPPAFSAISINGERSYKRARAGEVVEMPARDIEILGLDFVSYEAPLLTIDVTCSKGTYIRSLARDIGTRLGTCAHLADLRRTACSGFSIDNAMSEADLANEAKVREHVYTDLGALRGLEILEISNGNATRLRNGLRVSLEGAQPRDVVIAAHGGQPVAICKIENAELVSLRGFGSD